MSGFLILPNILERHKETNLKGMFHQSQILVDQTLHQV